METKTTQKELLQSQTNAEEAAVDSSKSSKELITRQPSKANPMFLIIGTDEQGYMVTFGKWQITKRYKSIVQCEEKIFEKDYELLFALMGVAIETNKEIGTTN